MLSIHKNLLFLALLLIASLCGPAVLATGRPADPAAKPGNAHAGQEVFTKRCFQCHSVLPDQVKLGPSVYGEMKKPNPKKTASEVRAIVNNGKGKMPAFKEILTQQEMDDLLVYLRTL
jgi:mono/diheme cytochrome c family protein